MCIRYFIRKKHNRNSIKKMKNAKTYSYTSEKIEITKILFHQIFQKKLYKLFKIGQMSAPTPEKVNIDVTLLLRGKQRLYGVKNNEYERYAQYCSRRVVRLAHLMKKREDCVEMKGPKYNLSANINQNAEHMQIVLFKADGAFARYRFLKNTAEKQKRKSHAISRLRKSQKWWQLAHECADAFCTEKTQLEVQAFQSYAKASLELELGHWSEALSTFTAVTDIFSDIQNASSDATLKLFCREMIDDITPLIEFCRFNLGQIDGQHIDAETRERIINIYEGSENLPTNTLSELKWRDKTVPIVHEGLRVKLATVVDLINDIHKEGHEPQFAMKLFDKLITESHSARQTIRSISSKGESEELQTIDSFLDWNSYIVTLERSRILLSTLSTPSQKADLASRTYLRISENKSKYENDPAIDALLNIWRSLKVFYIADVSTVSSEKSFGLLERAKNYINTALNIISSENVDNPPSLQKWATEIQDSIRKVRIVKIAHANGVVGIAGKRNTTEEAERPFLEDLNSFTSCPTLVQIPPLPKSVTPKGMIFNNARDEHLDYPDISAKLKKKSWSARLKFW